MNDLISRKSVSAWLYNMGYEKLSEYVLDEKRFLFVDRQRGKWIPCSERLPKIGMKTILLYDSEEISGGTYIGNLTWNDAFASKNEFVKVIAWMPLPEPPKGADNE